TPSRARMMRLLRQFSVLMSSSVSVTSSRVRTSMNGGPFSCDGCRYCSGYGVCRGLTQDIETASQLLVRQRQRRQQLDHLVARTGGLHQQTGLEGVLAGGRGVIGVAELETAGQATSLGGQTVLRVVGD